MPSTLAGKTVGILVADGFEQVEFTSPKAALENAGAKTVVVSLKPGKVQGFNHHEKGDAFSVDKTAAQVRADDYDALLLPGGVANPDQLRADPDAVAFVRGFFEQHKPVAAICHGPWTLIDAGVVRGRRMTSYKSIKTDLINAGAEWSDEAVVVDNGLVTSRTPPTLSPSTPRWSRRSPRGSTPRSGRDRRCPVRRDKPNFSRMWAWMNISISVEPSGSRCCTVMGSEALCAH